MWFNPGELLKTKTKRTYRELLRLAANTFDMCQLYGVDFGSCIKLNGIGFPGAARIAFDDDPEKYEFAIGVLENKPVFKGDEIYRLFDGRKFWACSELTITNYAWEKPQVKKIFMLNGVEFPAPISINNPTGNFYFNFNGTSFSFESLSEMNEVRDEIRKILVEAANKVD
jgi:hypothetical protein